MKIHQFLIMSLMGVSAALAHAQSWPEKPVKLIAPSTAGGPPDVYARALADHMSKVFGQPFVVENIPAGGGMIAAQQIMRATPDGYTLLVNTAGMMTITPNAHPRAQYKAGDFRVLMRRLCSRPTHSWVPKTFDSWSCGSSHRKHRRPTPRTPLVRLLIFLVTNCLNPWVWR